MSEGLAFPQPLDEAALRHTWDDAWAELGLRPPEGVREELERAWSQRHRHYHAPRHLRECLALWQRWRGHAEHPAEVALALWWHDAVYKPRAADNEQRSADWAKTVLLGAGASADAAQRVHDLIMATRHDAPAHGRDAELLVDIDLAILGSPATRFERYDEDVRREYRWVPTFIYRHKRAQVLRQFLLREPLYHTQPARALLEAQAKANLAGALARLEG